MPENWMEASVLAVVVAAAAWQCQLRGCMALASVSASSFLLQPWASVLSPRHCHHCCCTAFAVSPSPLQSPLQLHDVGVVVAVAATGISPPHYRRGCYTALAKSPSRLHNAGVSVGVIVAVAAMGISTRRCRHGCCTALAMSPSLSRLHDIGVVVAVAAFGRRCRCNHLVSTS
jgi:hypothetical protein